MTENTNRTDINLCSSCSHEKREEILFKDAELCIILPEIREN